MVETRRGAHTEPGFVPNVDEMNGGKGTGAGTTMQARAGAGRGGRRGRGIWWYGGMNDAQAYMMLALAHLGLAIPLMFSTKMAAKALFGKTADPVEDQHGHLMGLYASGLLSSAASAFALEESARRNTLHSWTSDILKLGLMAHSVSNSLLMLYYPATLTVFASAVEWLAIMATFALPASHTMWEMNDRRRIWNDCKRGSRDMWSFLNLRHFNFTAFMYTLFTIMFPMAGMSYFVAPRFTLYHTFGYDYGKSTQMLWKAIGGGALMSFLPAMTLVLRNKAMSSNLSDTTARALNLGLLGTATGHLLVFGPIMARGHGGFMLPLLLGTWTLVLITGMLGLSSPELEQLQEAARQEYREQMQEGGTTIAGGPVGTGERGAYTTTTTTRKDVDLAPEGHQHLAGVEQSAY